MGYRLALVTFDLGWPWTVLEVSLFKVAKISQDFSVRYLEYGERPNVEHKGGQTGNHLWTCDWHCERWPWM